MLKYFKNCTTKEECKKLYKKLAFIHHPDRGGDTETMKAINAEFDYVIENNIFKSSKKDTKKDAKKDTYGLSYIITLTPSTYFNNINIVSVIKGDK